LAPWSRSPRCLSRRRRCACSAARACASHGQRCCLLESMSLAVPLRASDGRIVSAPPCPRCTCARTEAPGLSPASATACLVIVVVHISLPDSLTALSSPACPFACRGEVEDPGHSDDGMSPASVVPASRHRCDRAPQALVCRPALLVPLGAVKGTTRVDLSFGASPPSCCPRHAMSAHTLVCDATRPCCSVSPSLFALARLVLSLTGIACVYW
jgi:hypothetical protein